MRKAPALERQGFQVQTVNRQLMKVGTMENTTATLGQSPATGSLYDREALTADEHRDRLKRLTEAEADALKQLERQAIESARVMEWHQRSVNVLAEAINEALQDLGPEHPDLPTVLEVVPEDCWSSEGGHPVIEPF